MTTFVTMYHPALNNVRVQAPLEAEALYEAHGWVLDGGTAPPPADIYLTPALGDVRYAPIGSGGGGALTDAAMASALGSSTATAMAARAELKAALVPFWAAGETVTAGAVRMDPTGHTITRNSNGTTRGSYDATEAALWTVVSGGGGAGSVASANITDATTIGKALLTAADAAAERTALGLGSAATQPSSAFDAAGAAALRAPLLTPTATKTAAYTAAVGDLAVMNVAGGATALTLPTASADKAQVGFLAIGATTAAPLTVNRGGADTLGTSAATSVTVPLSNEVTVYQYDAPNTRWLAVANVKPLTQLDARYDAAGAAAAAVNGLLTGFVQGGATVMRSHTTLYDDAYSFAARIRPVDTARRLVRVHNMSPTASVDLGYGSNDNSNYNNPTFTFTVGPGQEWIDTSGDPRSLFMRDTVNGSPALLSIYSESAVA